MYSEKDVNKMREFVLKLMSNPCFNNETPLMREENLLLFLVQNYQALKTTLMTAQYFPNLSWQDIEKLYVTVLQEEINKKINPQIQIMTFKRIDYTFVNLMLHRSIDNNNFADQIFKFCLDLLKRFEIRKVFDSAYKIINYNIIDKYIQEIFAKRSYIAFELEKVEKLRFSPEIIVSYIKFELLVSLSAFIRTDIDDLTLQQKMNLTDIKFGNSAMQKSHYEKIVKQFMKSLTYFPQELLLKAMKTHLSFIEDQTIPATCRLAKVFFLLGKNFKPNLKIDKGAETQEKSWFGLQKKNFKYYGFDIKMIEELYRIAAENFW